MQKNHNQHNSSILAKFFVVTFVVFAIVLLPVGGYLKSVFGFIAEPISFWTNSLTSGVNSTFLSLGDIFTLREEYNNLKIQYAKLQAESSNYTLLSDENSALKQQLNLGKNDVKQLQVEVVSGGVYGQSEYLIINKGKNDGIKSGQKAVLGNILVGIVGEVNDNSSRVILPFSRSINFKVKVVTVDLSKTDVSKIDAQSKDLVYANGVTTGTINGIRVENIAETFDVKVGQSVIADDEKVGMYLVLGNVSRVEKKDSDPTKSAIIEPPVNYYDLRYLFIIL